MNLFRLVTACTAGAAGFAGLAWYGDKRADATAQKTADAVSEGGDFSARVTGYWPFTAKESEKKMEGGANDRKGKRLHTLEEHLANPALHPYVAVSGDDAIFPYGQRLSISEWPAAVFRVVDTGGNFRGFRKVYRVWGSEPLDVCVASSGSKVIPITNAKAYKGDHFDTPGKEIAAGKFKGQEVVLGRGLDFFAARTA